MEGNQSSASAADDGNDGKRPAAAKPSADASSASSNPSRKRRKVEASGNVEDEMRMETSSSNSSSDDEDDDDKNPSLGSRSSSDIDGSNDKPGVDPVLLQHAKNRLSKFAARLFDPNRPKGLVEPPQIIPLNDEFLTAFGKREKDFDEATGRAEEFEHEIQSDDDDDGDKNDVNNRKKDLSITTNRSVSKHDSGGAPKTKIKINNLAYRTTEETLTNACLMFGTLKVVNMILHENPPAGSDIHNSGRAFVTFDTEEAALACIDGLKTLEGRDLRITLATVRTKTPKASSGAATPATASLLNKMFERDISTICFRCGNVGHMEASCPNPPKPKPCTLCGYTDHDQRMCPCNRICFNCGAPGHLNRECTLRRGLPRRMVCGICLRSGHHRLQCHQRVPAGDVAHAVCMSCGQKGHFLCKDLKWFFGLRGLFCFNCGSRGHSGYDCQRPALHHCIQNPEDAVREIERAEANSIAEELEQQRQGRGRTMQREHNGRNGSGGNRNRGSNKVQSMPPAQKRGGQQQQNHQQQGLGCGRRDRRGYS